MIISSKSLGCLHLIANDTACTFATVDISTLACFESSAGFVPSVDETDGALLYFPLLKPLKGELRALDVLIANGPAAPVANELLLLWSCIILLCRELVGRGKGSTCDTSIACRQTNFCISLTIIFEV